MSSYAIISPCRNEAKLMRRTLDAVVAQSLTPSVWVIVDDGSTDETPKILREYAARHSFIRIVTREDRGHRRVGGGVIDAFNVGLQAIDLTQHQYVCKLDLDLDLPSRYFAWLIERMEGNPRLGTCSGKPFYVVDGVVHYERLDDANSVGMTKLYRTECFLDIGGFESEVMWDGIDCHRCRMLGWQSRAFTNPEVRFEHLRPMGSSDKGIHVGRARHGRGQYYMGTHPAFLLASAASRLNDRPIVTGSLAMIYGYCRAAIFEQKRYDDPEFRQFLRSFQLACLRRGKSAAIAQVEAENEAVWLSRVDRGHRCVPEAHHAATAAGAS